jgi:uncharacterized protein
VKYLIVLVVVLVAFWVWRNNRQTERDDQQRTRAARQPPKLEDMVSCPVCSVHLPAADAVAGRNGLYCSVNHRQQAED